MSNPGFLFTVLAFLLVIGPLIFIHELGHYFVGRWFGVKADTFSIGFGREIFGWTDKRGTRWKVGWLPLGGYVKFAGDMNPAAHADATNGWRCRPRSAPRPSRPRSSGSASSSSPPGPVTNFLFAIVALMIHLRRRSAIRPRPPSIGAIEPGSAAAAAGFRPGDRIVAVDGSGDRHLRRPADLCRAAARAGRWPSPSRAAAATLEIAARRRG